MSIHMEKKSTSPAHVRKAHTFVIDGFWRFYRVPVCSPVTIVVLEIPFSKWIFFNGIDWILIEIF